MKLKSFITVAITILFSLSLFSQSEATQPHWSDIPSGIYRLRASGHVRIIIKSDSKKNYYDLGTKLKEYISSGQEINGSSFVQNGTITITPETLGSAGQIRIYLKEPLLDIELTEGALLIYETSISQPSMKVKLVKSKLYSDKKMSVNNFVIENSEGVLDMKKANFKSAIFNITPKTENTISGSISNQQIYVIE